MELRKRFQKHMIGKGDAVYDGLSVQTTSFSKPTCGTRRSKKRF
jgi:hypothetical protein